MVKTGGVVNDPESMLMQSELQAPEVMMNKGLMVYIGRSVVRPVRICRRGQRKRSAHDSSPATRIAQVTVRTRLR